MEKEKITITAIQMESIIGNKKANFDKVANLIDNNIKQNTDILILPELWNVGWACDKFIGAAEELENSETINFLSLNLVLSPNVLFSKISSSNSSLFILLSSFLNLNKSKILTITYSCYDNSIIKKVCVKQSFSVKKFCINISIYKNKKGCEVWKLNHGKIIF